MGFMVHLGSGLIPGDGQRQHSELTFLTHCDDEGPATSFHCRLQGLSVWDQTLSPGGWGAPAHLVHVAQKGLGKAGEE